MVGPVSVTGRGGSLARARVATATIFLIIGTVFGNWVSRVPTIKDQVHANSGPLGAALLGIAAGAVLARPWCGRLVMRFGSRSVTRVTTVCCCLSLILSALADNALTLGLALTAFGAALGSVDIAMNTHAVAVERQFDRPIMSGFHGVYSIGGLVGALVGGRAAAWGLSPRLHFTLVAAVLIGVALFASSYLLPSSMDAVPPGVRARARPPFRGRSKDRRFPLILLGVIGLCSMAGEGAVGDWGAVYLHDDLGSSVLVASWGFAAYSLAMVVGRLLGNPFVARWGDWRIVTCSTAAAGLGFALALVIDRPAAAICGFVVLGLGLSLIVPITVSKAGQLSGDTAAPGVALVSSISGLGPIAVPPVIGFLAEGIGLPAALGAVSVLTLTAGGLIQVVQRLTKPAPATPPAIVALES